MAGEGGKKKRPHKQDLHTIGTNRDQFPPTLFYAHTSTSHAFKLSRPAPNANAVCRHASGFRIKYACRCCLLPCTRINTHTHTLTPHGTQAPTSLATDEQKESTTTGLSLINNTGLSHLRVRRGSFPRPFSGRGSVRLRQRLGVVHLKQRVREITYVAQNTKRRGVTLGARKRACSGGGGGEGGSTSDVE